MYTVKLLGVTEARAQTFVTQFEALFRRRGKYTLQLGTPERDPARKYGSGEPGWAITVQRVRLTAKKAYCGQHPGPCQVPLFPQPKRKLALLEWDDWVSFHGAVNSALDRYALSADVWSKPAEASGRMWIRLGSRRRMRWDWDSDRGRQVWNLGTDDQFSTPWCVQRRCRSRQLTNSPYCAVHTLTQQMIVLDQLAAAAYLKENPHGPRLSAAE